MPTPLPPNTSTTTQNHPKPSRSFQPPKPASLLTVKLSHDDSPNDSEKQLLAAHDFARSSWKETTGPEDIPSTLSTGRLGKALDTLENSAKIFIVKFAHDLLPTHRHMHRIRRAAHDKCPACIHLTETDWYILSYPTRSL